MVYLYKGHPTVEGFWDKYHLEFPDIYDRFALTTINVIDHIQQKFGFTDKNVLDIGSGTGKSTFRIAQYANNVTGIEPAIAMRNYAENKKRKSKIGNVEFIDAVGEDLSQFDDNEFDCVVSITALPILWEDTEIRKRKSDALVNECIRVVHSGGFIVLMGKTPGFKWDHLVGGMNSYGDSSEPCPTEELLAPHGFIAEDIRCIIDYATVEEALATYGFIYGESAIDYILNNKTTRFSWMLRLLYRLV